jgi:hypothetical protein
VNSQEALPDAGEKERKRKIEELSSVVVHTCNPSRRKGD